MSKPVRIVLIIALCIAAAAALYVVLNPANQKQPGAAPSESVSATATETANAQPSGTPAPTPEPTAVPEPEPLALEKQPLTFAQLAPTTTMAFEELAGDNDVYDEDDLPPFPAGDTYKLVINVYHQFATVYKKDANGEFTVPVRYIVVSSGARKTPTPIGTFEMGTSSVRFGKFQTYGVYGQYWRQIVRSIFCHSLIYESRNPRSYTVSYNELGKRASHGCVRMLVPDVRWIYYNLGPGTVCEIITGDKNDTEAAAIKAQLIRAPKPAKRPDLTPGSYTVTEAWAGWQGNARGQYEDYLASLQPPEVETANGDGEA